MIISTDAEKAFGKIQYPFMKKTLNKLGIEGNFLILMGFPGGSAGQESACIAGDLGSIPGFGRFPGEGKGCPLQYSSLENYMDCIVHGVTKSRTRLSDFLLLILIKDRCIYTKPTAKVILHGERMKAFPQRSGTRQRCPLSLLFNTIWGGGPTRAVRLKKKASKGRRKTIHR